MLRTSRITRLSPGESSALRTARQQTEQMRSALRQAYIDNATADGCGGATSTGVRWWLKFCIYGRCTSPVTHLPPGSPWADLLEAEQLLVDFVLWLALCKPSGRPISARSIAKYVGQVRTWHNRTQRTQLCGELDNQLIKDVLRSVQRMVPQPAAMRRYGVRTQDLSQAIREQLDTNSVEGAMWAAALSTAFCGLLRGCEFSLQDRERWSRVSNLSRADVKFKTSADGTEYMVLMINPAKRLGQKKDVPLLIAAGGSLLDPVRMMRRMIELDPVPADQEATTPLFRRASGYSIRVREVRGMVQQLMARLGLDPRRFGAHSLRIGGATAALAAGMSAAAIRE